MSNLYKFSTVSCDSNTKKVIDSNSIISEKIVRIKEAFDNEKNKSEDGFTLGLNAEHVEVLLDENGNTEDILVDSEEDEIAMAKENANAILESARIEAERVIAEAKMNADRILHESIRKANENMKQAHQEGLQKGYEEGRNQGEVQIQMMREELEEHRQKLDMEYDERVKRMEPELVDILLKIFAEVTHVLAADKRELILTLVNSVMSGTEVSNNYIIRTNKEDAHFLRDNRERIHGMIGRNINIEIVEDLTMKRNQCMIDTDLGIYDCSLDIQLENLIDNIKILACSSVDYFK